MRRIELERSRLFALFFERSIPDSAVSSVRGVLLAAVIAFAARFVSDRIGGPAVLYALLLGMSLHWLSGDERVRTGIDLAAKTLLRLGIVLIGVRISFDHVLSLGVATIALVVVAVVSTTSFSVWFGKRLGWPTAESALAGGAVSICGASAALALAAAMPAGRARENLVSLVAVGVTAFSTLAMLLYPLIVRGLELAPNSAGIFIGGAIHDVAQVVGAGYLLGQEAGDMATLTKMLRIALLVPLVIALTWMFRRDASCTSERTSADVAAKKSVQTPVFLVAFVCMMAVNSAGWVSPSAVTALTEVSRQCVLLAIAALGLRTSFACLTQLGWRPLILLAADTILIAEIVLIGIWMLR